MTTENQTEDPRIPADATKGQRFRYEQLVNNGMTKDEAARRIWPNR